MSNKIVNIQRISDCEWDSPELFPESPCHNVASHVDRVSGFVFCHAHADSFEHLAVEKHKEYQAQFEQTQSQAEPEPEKAEDDHNQRTEPQGLSGPDAAGILGLLTS